MNKLCYAAAHAVLGGSAASFERLCSELAELAAAAGRESRSANMSTTLRLLSKEGLAQLAAGYCGDLCGVYLALQRSFGWSAQDAATALLADVGLRPTGIPRAERERWAACAVPGLLSTNGGHLSLLAELLRCACLLACLLRWINMYGVPPDSLRTCLGTGGLLPGLRCSQVLPTPVPAAGCRLHS